MNHRHLLIILIAAIALGTLALLYPSATQKPSSRPVPQALQPLLLPEARPLQPFALQDAEGAAFDLARLEGKWSFLFIGYTHCPDICPTALGMMKEVAKRLEQSPELYAQTQFVFISVDPKRDTLPHLKQYIGYFHPDFIAATGEKEALNGLVRQLGGMYMFDGDTSGNDYIVNHSASIVLVDPAGRWVARFNPPHTVNAMVEGFQQLRDYLQP